jgi:hypothetical protein
MRRTWLEPAPICALYAVERGSFRSLSTWFPPHESLNVLLRSVPTLVSSARVG